MIVADPGCCRGHRLLHLIRQRSPGKLFFLAPSYLYHLFLFRPGLSTRFLFFLPTCKKPSFRERVHHTTFVLPFRRKLHTAVWREAPPAPPAPSTCSNTWATSPGQRHGRPIRITFSPARVHRSVAVFWESTSASGKRGGVAKLHLATWQPGKTRVAALERSARLTVSQICFVRACSSQPEILQLNQSPARAPADRTGLVEARRPLVKARLPVQLLSCWSKHTWREMLDRDGFVCSVGPVRRPGHCLISAYCLAY